MPEQKKVLISYFFEPDSIPLGFACADAFRDLGFSVKTFHSQKEHPLWPVLKHFNKIFKVITGKVVDFTEGTRFNNQVFRERGLKELVDQFDPDILLVIRGDGYSSSALNTFREAHDRLKIMGWWVKDPRNDNQMINDAKSYDYYFCMHNYGYDSQSGIVHLPALGVYSQLYKPTCDRLEKSLTTDICFVGGYAKRRGDYAKSIMDLNLEIYGPGWKKKENLFNARLREVVKGSSIWGPDLVSLYGRSKIVLSISSWNPQELGGQNLRLFDVPACGAFLLTDFSDEISEFYRIGVDVETFRDAEELRDKVRYYLDNPSKREKIAKSGYRKTLELPNYKDKMSDILHYISK